MRLIVAALSFVCGLYMALYLNHFAWIFLIAALLLCWDALRNASVWAGFGAFRHGDLLTVRAAVQQVRWPQLLSPSSRAYYQWLKGTLEAADGRLGAAKVHLLLAVSGELHTENDRSLLHCLLAEIALQEGDKVRAEEHLHHAAALKHHPDVNRIINSLSARLAG